MTRLPGRALAAARRPARRRLTRLSAHALFARRLSGRPQAVRPLSRRWLSRRWLLVLAVLPGLTGGMAYAYWSSSDVANPAVAVADVLPTGATPTVAPAGGSAIAVSFDRVATTSGTAVTDYLVRRYDGPAATTPSATFACSWPVGAALACADTDVPDAAAHYYTDTPRLAGTGWFGTESARSAGASTDTTAPTAAVTSITPPANGAGYHNASPITLTLTGTDEAGGSGVASISYQVDASQVTVVAGPTATVAVSGDGSHLVAFHATDRSGNPGADVTQTIVIDTVPPGAATITSYPSAVTLANQGAVAVGGSAEAGATVTVTVADAGAAHLFTRTAVASGAGAWSVTGLDLTGLSDGAVSVRAQAVDAAGNTGAPATVTATKDTVAPAVAVTSATDPVSAANRTAAAAAGSTEPGATVTLAVSDGTSTVTAPVTVTGGTWSATGINLTTLADGALTYTATATDAVGNTATATRAATKDTAAPSVTAVAVGPAGNPSTGAIRAAGTYYVYANAADPAPGTLASVTANAGTLTAGPTAVPLSSTGGPFTAGGVAYAYRSAALTADDTLPAGARSVTVTATDAGTNSAASTGSVTVDNTAPTPVTVTLANRTGGVAGKPEVGDTITLGYSEVMDPHTLVPAWSVGSTATVTNAVVTFQDSPSGNGTNKNNDSVSLTAPAGIALGQLINFEGHLVPTQLGSYSFTASVQYAVVGGQTVITVTLTALNSGGSTVGTATSSTFTWTPATTATDLATNPVSGTRNGTAVPF